MRLGRVRQEVHVSGVSVACPHHLLYGTRGRLDRQRACRACCHLPLARRSYLEPAGWHRYGTVGMGSFPRPPLSGGSTSPISCTSAPSAVVTSTAPGRPPTAARPGVPRGHGTNRSCSRFRHPIVLLERPRPRLLAGLHGLGGIRGRVAWIENDAFTDSTQLAPVERSAFHSPSSSKRGEDAPPASDGHVS